MAKNKNRDRSKQQPAPAGERNADESKPSSTNDRSEQIQSRIAPPENPAKGRQKRFGHN